MAAHSGNLTLTGYNPELGNMPFENKKAKLQESNFELSKAVVVKEVWNDYAILERGRELAVIAAGLWRRA